MKNSKKQSTQKTDQGFAHFSAQTSQTNKHILTTADYCPIWTGKKILLWIVAFRNYEDSCGLQSSQTALCFQQLCFHQ